MTYDEALARLLALSRFGVRPGLEAMRRLLARLGDPQRALPVVHIGGTNGKGSTAAFVEAALRAAGRRTGLYTSPHLLRFGERIRLDGQELSPDALAGYLTRVFAVAGDETFFEIATAAALLAFAERKVEVAVLEVGLGGRLDATNVVERPLVTVITGVALDHTEVLGDTLVAIAREKAGIWKPGVAAVAACEDAAACAVLEERAAQLEAPLSLYGRDFDDRALPPLGLLGAHQRRNAALARRALQLLPPALRPAEALVAEGFANVRWPGRLEWLAPDVLVDGAHNGDGARALAAALPVLAAGRPVTLILGVVADKDARSMATVLAPCASRVIATAPPSPRALPAAALAALLPGCEVAPDLASALGRARGQGLCVVAGSLFLVAEARRLLSDEARDSLPVQDPMGVPVTGR